MPDTRNVLLLIADDWSPVAGCYGNSSVSTPTVDQLAQKGILFTQAFCTSPSCAASRATLLTGLYSHAHGQYGHCHGPHTFRTLPTAMSLPAILRGNKIFTGIIGKQHTLPSDVYPWDFNEGDTNPTMINHRDPNQLKVAAQHFFNKAQGTPFYLHVGFSTPHREEDGFGNTEHYAQVPLVRYRPNDVVVPDFLPDTPEVREDLADYYSALSRLDFSIGKILEALQESGRASETLIIVMSDHGMPFPGAKATSFDSGHHCPLIVLSPEATRAGIRNSALVSWVDIMPAILEWFNIPLPGTLHGRSFLSILEEEQPSEWDEVFFSHTFHGVTEYFPYRAIRSRRYKYVLNLFPELTLPLPTDLLDSKTWRTIVRDRLKQMGERNLTDVLHQRREMLYDIKADPCETRNLIDESSLSGMVNVLRRKVEAFRQRTDDLWLLASEQAYLQNWPPK